MSPGFKGKTKKEQRLVMLVCMYADYKSTLTTVHCAPYLSSLCQAEAAATLVYWRKESYTILGALVEGGSHAWT
jgi:hypothetical protein